MSEISDVVDKLFGYDMPGTRTFMLNQRDWDKMFGQVDEDINTKFDIGRYIPKTNTAYILEDSGWENTTLYHETFGHGWFFEKSLLVKDKNPEDVARNNYALIEGFALWVEQYLSSHNNSVTEFREKQEFFYTEHNNNLLKQMNDLENKVGFLGVLAYAGMPRMINEERMLQTLRQIYGYDEINNSELIMLYGSKKPHSDVDLFIVNDNIKSFNNDWLDVYAMPREEFVQRLNLLDVSVTDPIYSGVPLIGEDKVPRIKNLLENKEITNDVINFNYQQSKIQEEFLQQNLSERDRKVAEGYAKTYFANATLMQNQNEKRFTKKELIRD